MCFEGCVDAGAVKMSECVATWDNIQLEAVARCLDDGNCQCCEDTLHCEVHARSIRM